ncbi:hypothetical protein BC832DRAFT_618053 [Gaertneriomyces semiglobifer]|nr:hypothetical protein BC832DRAFT_618053 [Gaertneriomyces semiglobifer]
MLSRRAPSRICREGRLIGARAMATASSPTVNVGLLLKRAPIILRTLTPFEHAYYHYREVLSLKEARPFNPDFYFKKGSTAEQRWLEAQERAEAEAGKLGEKYVPVQPKEEELLALQVASREGAKEKEAEKSLDRKGERTLYLLVKGKDGWRLPEGALEGSEVLHEAAARHLKSTIGTRSETWVVGRTPFGYHGTPQRKTFFMKAHIISGRVEPKIGDNFAWLSKDEIQERVDVEYWKSVCGMFAEL